MAGPPFWTDDPEPAEYKHWEVYFASQYFGLKDGSIMTAPHVEINCGVIPNLQLHLIAPMVNANPAGEKAHYGYGDTELGAKYRFVQEGDWCPMVGTFPLVEIPTGKSSAGSEMVQCNYSFPFGCKRAGGHGQLTVVEATGSILGRGTGITGSLAWWSNETFRSNSLSAPRSSTRHGQLLTTRTISTPDST